MHFIMDYDLNIVGKVVFFQKISKNVFFIFLLNATVSLGAFEVGFVFAMLFFTP